MNLFAIAVIAASLISGASAWWATSSHWKQKYTDLQLEQAKLDLRGWADSVADTSKALEDYSEKLTKIANRKPAPSVWLCDDTGMPAAPGGADPGRAGELPRAPGQDPAAPRRDIGAELYELADDADRLAERKNALSKTVRKR